MQRMAFLAAALIAGPTAAVRAKPITYIVNVELPGLTQLECLQRAGPAMLAMGFHLATPSRTEQPALRGDYVGNATCAAGARLNAFVLVTGPDPDSVVRLARGVRNRMERPNGRHVPPPQIPVSRQVGAASQTARAP